GLALSEIVRMAGLQARPLEDGPSIGTELSAMLMRMAFVLSIELLRPTRRRVLPRFMSPVDGQVEQPIAVIHRFDAANRRPVSFEDIGFLSQVANDVHHAHTASDQEGVKRVLGRVPRHLPAHKAAVTGAFFVWALAEHREGNVTRMNVGQFAHLRCKEGAPLALFRCRATGVPHEIISDKHPAALKGIQQRHRPTLANERCGPIDLDHAEPPASSRNGVAFPCVGLLSSPQCVQLRLEGPSIDYFGRSNFIFHTKSCIVLSGSHLAAHAIVHMLMLQIVGRREAEKSDHRHCGCCALAAVANATVPPISLMKSHRRMPGLAAGRICWNSSHRSIKPARRNRVPSSRLCNAESLSSK